MIKVVIFIRRRPGMAAAAFREHWRERHAPLIVKLPGIRRYVQNAPLDEAYPAGEPPFDGVAESSFDDTQAMKALAKSPEYAAVLADEPNFIDRPNMGSIITEEQVLKDGSAKGIKRITFVSRPAQTPVDDFFRQWREQGERIAKNAAILRYAQCAVRRSIYDSGRTPAFDGAAMSWFADLNSAKSVKEEAFGDADRSKEFFADERVVLG